MSCNHENCNQGRGCAHEQKDADLFSLWWVTAFIGAFIAILTTYTG